MLSTRLGGGAGPDPDHPGPKLRRGCRPCWPWPPFSLEWTKAGGAMTRVLTGRRSSAGPRRHQNSHPSRAERLTTPLVIQNYTPEVQGGGRGSHLLYHPNFIKIFFEVTPNADLESHNHAIREWARCRRLTEAVTPLGLANPGTQSEGTDTGTDTNPVRSDDNPDFEGRTRSIGTKQLGLCRAQAVGCRNPFPPYEATRQVICYGMCGGRHDGRPCLGRSDKPSTAKSGRGERT